MRIVFLADAISTQTAGIHYYGKQLIQNITSTYPAHTYLVISTQALNLDNTEDVVVSNKGDSSISLRLRQIIKLPQIVDKLNPDIVIELAHFGPFRLRPSIKRVTVVHDLTPITHPQFHGLSSNLSHKILLGGILSKAAHIICNSNTTKQAILANYPNTNGKINVVYPRLDIVSNQKQEKENYFLSIGTIEPRKNYPILLAGFDSYCEQGGTSRMKIIGSQGWGMREFQRSFNQMKHISKVDIHHEVGRDGLFDYLAKSKAYVSCSHYEGFGLPVLEAMSQSVPLVLSDIEVYREIADDVALFFDKDDKIALSHQLQSIENYLDSFSKKSFEKYETFEAMKLSLPFLDESS